MKSYTFVQLEDMLGHVFSGRADTKTIDELIAWLQARRPTAQPSGQEEGCPKSEDGRHHYYQDFEPGRGVVFDCICGKRR